MQKIQVAVPIPTVAGSLTYAVPSTLSGSCQPGVRVQVPVRGRKMVGVVTWEDPPGAACDFEASEIHRTVDESPVISRAQFELCQFVSRYYLASLGETMRLCLPPDTKRDVDNSYKLTKKGREICKDDSDPFSGLLKHFPKYASLTKSTLKKRKIAGKILKDLVLRGFVCSGGAEEVKPGNFPLYKRGIEGDFTGSAESEILPNPPLKKEGTPDPYSLTPDQQHAVNAILAATDKSAFLLEGVTGSGKTEVYIRIAREMLSQGKSVLVIAPEIALTPQLQDYFSSALQTPIAMLHSGFSQAERRDAHFALLQREIRVVVGARSALFAPLPELGLIIVDEEHDQSLKQDKSPRYHGRDVALWRARNESAKIILGSATPSLESQHNTLNGKLQHLQLKERIGGKGALPSVEVVDLSKRAKHSDHRKRDRAATDGQSLCILSGPLLTALGKTIEAGEQAILFLNRRGYSAFAICNDCGEVVQCKNCSVSMTYYSRSNLLRCHQCDYFQALPERCAKHIPFNETVDKGRNCHSGLDPESSEVAIGLDSLLCGHDGPLTTDHCPPSTQCGGDIICLGLGTERVEQEVTLQFPEANVARLDREVAKSSSAINKVLSSMRAGDTDILIGTQMVAKGHDFPNVSLVGVILADNGLAMPDFRASERTFQLLTQVAGRAGRGNTRGKVIIQTFNPLHPSIVHAIEHDTKGFSKLELKIRKEMHQPPFVRAALIRIEGPQLEGVIKAASQTAHVITQQIKRWKLDGKLELLGPAPAPIELARGKYRYQMYVRSQSNPVRHEVLAFLNAHVPMAKELQHTKCRMIIDVDPVNML